ncbi:MAG: SDR family oxidoreductase [Pseudomonadota bacterium]|nr:SDR family oxidoreductase [Pseudomonadota bacterium]
MKLQGKVALVTGANTGIGRVTARELALQGAHVFLACRSEQKTRAVLDEIHELSGGQAKAEFLPLDLGDLDSVRRCAEMFLARDLPLHLLICNAGLAGQRGMTESGFELIFGVCHVGHFLLTQLLLECIKASAPARIVVVASKVHRAAKSLDFDGLRQPTRSRTAMAEYAVAKLANILFAKELAKRLQGTGVTTYALHPGVVASDVWRAVPWPFDKLIKAFMLSLEQGAVTTLHCATSAAVATETGLYYDECQPVQPSRLACDAALAEQLWQESEAWVQP